MSTSTAAFRTLDTSDRLPEGYVNPYYLDDQKRRVSIARVDGKLYAFDDLCTHEACPLSAGLLTDTTLMLPVPRIAVRHHERRSATRPSDRNSRNLRGARRERRDPDSNVTRECAPISV